MQNSEMNNKRKNDIFKCDVCNVELQSKVCLEAHESGQKHMKLLNAKNERIRVELKCGIFVKGYPHDMGQDVLLAYFANYGSIVWTHFGYNFLLLDYSDPKAARTVINKQHRIHGRLLIVQYRQLRNQRMNLDESPPQSMSNLEELKTMRSLNHQVQILTQNLQGGMISWTHQSKYQTICRDISYALKPVYSKCAIWPFGSTLTGLFFWSSDVDIYISGVRRPNDEDIGYLYRLKSILGSSQYFSNLIVIGQAKIPILKCVHTPSNTNCDINIRNALGVCNSKLISYYIEVDKKIKDMMLVIKYWAKMHRITGQNHLFTNYSLCLMIIFYLQGNPYHLPSIKYLQGNVPSYEPIHERWNGDFERKMVYVPHIRATSLLDLLDNFFSYYSDFDYAKYVICPYVGLPFERKVFQDPKDIPTIFSGYKQYLSDEQNIPFKIGSSVCVQDPFEHSRNTTPNVSENTLNIFIKFCRHAKKMCKDGEIGLLHKMFTESPPNCDVTLLAQANFTQFGVTMGPNLKYLKQKLDAEKSSITIKDLWYESVKNFTVTVLKDFLNLQVDENDGATSSKQIKLEGQTDIHSYLNPIIASYKCCGRLNVWHSRKVVQKTTDKELKTLIEKETEVTKHLVELYKNISPTANIIEFEIVLEKRFEPAQVVFSLTKTASYKKTFKNFGEFFAKKFGSWFELYEKDLNASC